MLDQLCRRLQRQEEAVQCTLIADESDSVYSGMLPGYLSGIYSLPEITASVPKRCARYGIEYCFGRAVRIDSTRRVVVLEAGDEIAYDVLSINIGASLRGIEDVAGAAEYSVPVKPLSGVAAAVERLESAIQAGQTPQRAVVVGGGAAAFEVACTLQARFGKAGDKVLYMSLSGTNTGTYHRATAQFHTTIAYRAETVLATLPTKAQRAAHRVMEELCIQSVPLCDVFRVEESRLLYRSVAGDGYDDVKSIDSTVVIWATGPTPAKMFGELFDEPSSISDSGYIAISPTLEVVSQEYIFASGDCAEVAPHPGIPHCGAVAVRQAKPLRYNILRALGLKAGIGIPGCGRPKMRKFSFAEGSLPLQILNTGTRKAILIAGPIVAFSRRAMQLKDRIDRHWIRTIQT